jgi:sugar phosphate isomerase/epimerase
MDRMDRRAVLRSGLGLAAAAGAGVLAGATPALADSDHGRGHRRRVPPDQISIQLFTLREIIGNNPEPVLVALRRIGYTKVELAGTYGLTAAQLRRILDRTGVRATSAHVGPEGDFSRTVDDLLTLGCRQANMPFAAFQTPAEWSALADRLNVASALAARRGLRYGYHNHATEFARLPGSRRTGYDILLAECDRRLVHMQLDLYWAVTGGVDPVRILRRDPRRFRQLHVKDRARDGSFADLGAGTIDFPRIFRHGQLRDDVEFIVEHDQPPNPLATAAVGYRYLRTLRF